MKFAVKLERFVTDCRGRRRTLSQVKTFGLPAITAAQYGSRDAGGKEPGKVFDNRRFACSADGEVANDDYFLRNIFGMEDAFVEKEVTHIGDGTVNPREGQQCIFYPGQLFHPGA